MPALPASVLLLLQFPPVSVLLLINLRYLWKPAAVPVEAVPVAAAEAPAAAPEAPAALEEDLYEQKTPLVGTVYVAPQAGAAPYVSVGDHVAAGDTVCIVESMKMFNEIAAECSGTIEEICINNGQIVEYGQVLFRIRED